MGVTVRRSPLALGGRPGGDGAGEHALGGGIVDDGP